MKKQKNVGLFGGTFDPMHHMHISIMVSVKEQLGLDEVWVLIDKNPRRKTKVGEYSHRLYMAKLSCKDFGYIKVDEIQMQKSGVTHGLSTQKELCRLYPDTKFSIILGEDSAQYFDKWESPEVFCGLVKFVVVKRPASDTKLGDMLNRLGDTAEKFDYQYVPVEPSDLSSSKIRKAVKIHKKVDGLSAEVLEYIRQNKLYEQ